MEGVPLGVCRTSVEEYCAPGGVVDKVILREEEPWGVVDMCGGILCPWGCGR